MFVLYTPRYSRHRLQNAIAYDKSNNPLQELTEDTLTIPKLIKVIDMHIQALRLKIYIENLTFFMRICQNNVEQDLTFFKILHRGTQIIENVFSADFFVLEAFCLIVLAIGIFEVNE